MSATRHLSWEEDAAFRRLLDTYYTTEKPIPADLRAACRLVMAQTDSQREAVRVVLDEFFALTTDGWVNKRADAEIDAMRVKQQKQRDKANKRWHKPEAAPGNATAPVVDAAASEIRADAMPPTPTPTPTPEEKTKTARKRAAAQLVSVDAMVSEGVDPQNAADWLVSRKAKDLPLTLTAWKLVKDEAAKAGLTLRDAIKTAAGNGWAGFKAAWLLDGGRTHSPTPAGVTVASAAADQTAGLLAEQAASAVRSQSPEAQAARVAAMAKLRGVPMMQVAA